MLTRDQINSYCEKLLPPTTALLFKVLGQRGADNAGVALFQALSKYRVGSPMTVEEFVRAKVPNLVRDIIRSEDGRKGQARHEGRSKTVSTSGIDGEGFDYGEEMPDAVEDADSEVRTIKTMETLTGLPRWLLMGRYFIGSTDTDLRSILNVSQTPIDRAVRQLRKQVA